MIRASNPPDCESGSEAGLPRADSQSARRKKKECVQNELVTSPVGLAKLWVYCIILGITFSFLIASPMINEIAVVMLLGIVGWEITLLYILAGIVVAFTGGLIIQKFKPERWVEGYVWKIQMGESHL